MKGFIVVLVVAFLIFTSSDRKEKISDKFCENIFLKPATRIDLNEKDISTFFNTASIFNFGYTKDYGLILQKGIKKVKWEFLIFRNICLITDEGNCIKLEYNASENFQDYLFISENDNYPCQNNLMEGSRISSLIITISIIYMYLIRAEISFCSNLFFIFLMGVFFISKIIPTFILKLLIPFY